MHQVLDFLGGCNWGPLPLLALMIYFWFDERQKSREKLRARIQENAAGGLCSHGRPRGRFCSSCAEEFVKEAEAEKSSAQDLVDQADEDLDELEDDEEDLDQVHLAPPAPKTPLRIDIPMQGAGNQVELEISTNANWKGAAGEIAVLKEYQLVTYCPGIPASTSNWRQSLSQSFGPMVRAIVIPDHEGIERIRVMINGMVVIDATPAVLLSLQEIRRV